MKEGIKESDDLLYPQSKHALLMFDILEHVRPSKGRSLKKKITFYCFTSVSVQKLLKQEVGSVSAHSDTMVWLRCVSPQDAAYKYTHV